MIVTILIKLISLLLGLTSYVLGFVTFNLPDNFLYAINNSFSFFRLLNGYFPIEAFWHVLLISIGFEVAYYTTKLLISLITLIRGGGKIEL